MFDTQTVNFGGQGADLRQGLAAGSFLIGEATLGPCQGFTGRLDFLGVLFLELGVGPLHGIQFLDSAHQFGPGVGNDATGSPQTGLFPAIGCLLDDLRLDPRLRPLSPLLDHLNDANCPRSRILRIVPGIGTAQDLQAVPQGVILVAVRQVVAHSHDLGTQILERGGITGRGGDQNAERRAMIPQAAQTAGPVEGPVLGEVEIGLIEAPQIRAEVIKSGGGNGRGRNGGSIRQAMGRDLVSRRPRTRGVISIVSGDFRVTGQQFAHGVVLLPFVIKGVGVRRHLVLTKEKSDLGHIKRPGPRITDIEIIRRTGGSLGHGITLEGLRSEGLFHHRLRVRVSMKTPLAGRHRLVDLKRDQQTDDPSPQILPQGRQPHVPEEGQSLGRTVFRHQTFSPPQTSLGVQRQKGLGLGCGKILAGPSGIPVVGTHQGPQNVKFRPPAGMTMTGLFEGCWIHQIGPRGQGRMVHHPLVLLTLTDAISQSHGVTAEPPQ